MVSKVSMHLAPRKWFAWKAISADCSQGVPWNTSPIFLTRVEPMKTGLGILKIEGVLVLRPMRPQRVSATLRVEFRSPQCILGCWKEAGREALVAITDVTMSWIAQYCGPLLNARSPSSLVDHNTPDTADRYLNTLFGSEEATILSQPDVSEFVDNAKAKPVSIEHRTMPQRYIGFDAWSILRGFRPAAMEQKWCIRSEQYHGGEAVAIYRSWTGFPVWKWSFTRGPDYIDMSEVEIAAHPEYHTPHPWPREGRFMQAVLEDRLLGRPTLLQAVMENELL